MEKIITNEYAERVEALSEQEQEYVKLIVEEHTDNLQEALDIIESGDYIIWFDCNSMADVAEKQVEEYNLLGSEPSNLRYYIDYDKWGRDLAIEGIFLEGDGYYLQIIN